MPRIEDQETQLIEAGKNERARTLAKVYASAGEKAVCTCGELGFKDVAVEFRHVADSATCPKAIWALAARMATLTISE